jgi:hypothetical protein
MQNIRDMADAIDRERLSRGTSLAKGERLVEGLRMWEDSLEWMKAGIRKQHPEADDEEVMRLVGERLERIRRVEEAGIYHAVEGS